MTLDDSLEWEQQQAWELIPWRKSPNDDDVSVVVDEDVFAADDVDDAAAAVGDAVGLAIDDAADDGFGRELPE